ncbi:MAG: hypothetical protein IVW36_05330 [Dehalococcoidia bacterium]|nr:hypothetical protein [Dehalococcoidia bacterium]
MLDAAPFTTVVLPGNHDPLIDASPYRRLPATDNLRVLGLPDAIIELPDVALVVRGKAHETYDDMHPLPAPTAAPPAKTAGVRAVVVAHGHYVAGPGDLHRAWLIRDGDIAALGADYVALGHWDRRERVGAHPHVAYYSGSPDLAQSINVVRMRDGAPAAVFVRTLIDGRETPG